MGLMVVLDPNVLIAAAQNHPGSLMVIITLLDHQQDVFLGVDEEEYKIFKEYCRHLELFTNNEYILQFVNSFLDLSKNKIISIPVLHMLNSDNNWLKTNQCIDPVEPELIAIGNLATSDCAILVTGTPLDLKGIRPRLTNNPAAIQLISQKYVKLNIWTTDSFLLAFSRKLIFLQKFPSSEKELQEYARTFKTETERVEYKQPDDPNGELTNSIIKEAMVSVCAFLNTDGGQVFIGISDSAEIIGFNLKYKGNNKNDDEILRIASSELSFFEPPTPVIGQDIISLANGRRVIVFTIKKSSDLLYKYDNKKELATYYRIGTKNIKKQVIPSKR